MKVRSGKIRMLVLAPYPVGFAPSQRLKYEQYYSAFEKAGYEVTTKSFVGIRFWRVLYRKGFLLHKLWFTFLGYLRRSWHMLSIPRYDLVYVHLWVTPLGLPVFEWWTRMMSKKIVYDIDDLIFLGHASAANKWSFHLKGRRKAIYLMKVSDHVITCTPLLDEFARKYNKHTTDISSTVDSDTYTPRSDYSFGDVPVLGWSGSHSTSRFLNMLADTLRELNMIHPFRLLVIGDAKFKMDGVDVEAITWNERTEVKDLSRIDIGLYPLPDERWVLGKSGLKAHQYMALGIPVVASAKGANFRIIENETNGFLIRDIKDWKEVLLRLLKDKALRERIGRSGRMSMVDRFSVRANISGYLEVLDRVSGRAR